MAPKQGERQVPASLAKFFKTTSTARKLMDPEGRLCELKPDNHDRELVYSMFSKREWDEMSWTQAKLYEAAQQDPSIRISRKKIDGRYLEIYQRDVFNEVELEKCADKPNMDASLAAVTLGYAQAKREYVYIISRKVSG